MVTTLIFQITARGKKEKKKKEKEEEIEWATIIEMKVRLQKDRYRYVYNRGTAYTNRHLVLITGTNLMAVEGFGRRIPRLYKCLITDRVRWSPIVHL